MPKLIKIAYIIDTIATRAAGTEKQLLMLLDKIDKTRFKPYLICLKNSDWLRNNPASVECHVLGFNSLFSISALKGLIKLKKIIEREQIDILQTFFKDANLFGTIAGKLFRVKIVISSRRNFGEYWHTTFWRTTLKLMRHWTTLYVSNSNVVAMHSVETEKIRADKILTIYNGLELEKFERINPVLRTRIREELSINNSDILVGLVANWRPVKNIPLFLKVAYRFKNEFPNVKFIVIGKPPDEDELSKVLNDLNIDLNVRFLGVIPDIIPFLSAMDIGVLCSTAESLSNSITEYLAAGLPCVVSQAGGNAEAIGYGIGGVVFQNNNEEDFYIRLKDLVSNPDQMKIFANQAKGYARLKYDYKTMIRSHEKLYSSIITKQNYRF